MMTMKLWLGGAFVLLVTGAAAPNLTGRNIAEHGNGQGAPPCTTCHGSHYQGNATTKAPALAGLPSAFILTRLAHYAGPEGHNPPMREVATALTLRQRQAVASYLSGLPATQDRPR